MSRTVTAKAWRPSNMSPTTKEIVTTKSLALVSQKPQQLHHKKICCKVEATVSFSLVKGQISAQRKVSFSTNRKYTASLRGHPPDGFFSNALSGTDIGDHDSPLVPIFRHPQYWIFIHRTGIERDNTRNACRSSSRVMSRRNGWKFLQPKNNQRIANCEETPEQFLDHRTALQQSNLDRI
ncbi:hypothetical protein RRG08_029145 [Elysia crispata]|uniref:Uncharacterized protein n=1 Tax=Elysia crispata TaxID=231223 RepID=A0AAE0Y784_9GAST|nr:hypothetical protein RRG08_029145 [Elysia crispata]